MVAWRRFIASQLRHEAKADPAPITGLDAAAEAGCTVFHAGTGTIGGELHATGGRVLAVTAVGSDIEVAARKAYRGVAAIDFEGAQHRADIGLAPSPEAERIAAQPHKRLARR